MRSQAQIAFAAQGKGKKTVVYRISVICGKSDHYTDCHRAFLQGDPDSLPAQYRNGRPVFWKKSVAYVFGKLGSHLSDGPFPWRGYGIIENSAAGMTFFWIQAVIAALILSVVTWYLGRRKQFGNQLFPVTLVHRGHAMEIMGYWDSGNQLRDPYDHIPVCILSRHMAAKILNPKKDRVHFIPYCSLGQKEGLLPVTEITCIKIQNGRHEVEIRPATVGIANEGLLEGKEYDMILHASMLECQERGTKHDHETCTAKI